VAALGGDQGEAREAEGAEAAPPGPSPADALRKLRLFRPSPPGTDAPRSPAPEEGGLVSWPGQSAEGTDHLVWEDLSWLERDAPTRQPEATRLWVEPSLLVAHAGAEPGSFEESSAAPDWGEGVHGPTRHALVLLGAVALPWSHWLGGFGPAGDRPAAAGGSGRRRPHSKQRSEGER
jgi:hypothetical protein